MTALEILKSCFHSDASLWQQFNPEGGELHTFFYPSAGSDFRPFVFAKRENLKIKGYADAATFLEPNLFIFSDYYPQLTEGLFDSEYLYQDEHTQIAIEDACELFPSERYVYHFNTEYVHFADRARPGKAVFFKAKIVSHQVEQPYFRYGIYFFYENVNLIQQLFLKNKMPFSHLAWKRDGSDFGGGKIHLDFIFHVAHQCETRYFFIWDNYLNEATSVQTNAGIRLKKIPKELSAYVQEDFEMCLTKKLQMGWGKYDRINFYRKK